MLEKIRYIEGSLYRGQTVVTSSADAISRLTDAQIQNIINLYTDELTKSQKLVGVIA